SITPAPDSTHVCQSCCGAAVPKTLFITDGAGTHTLTWDVSNTWWEVCYLYTTSPVTSTSCGLPTQTSTTPIMWILTCNPTTNQWNLDLEWSQSFACGSPPSCYPYYSSPITSSTCSSSVRCPSFITAGNGAFDSWSGSCSPFSRSGTVTNSGVLTMPSPVGY